MKANKQLAQHMRNIFVRKRPPYWVLLRKYVHYVGRLRVEEQTYLGAFGSPLQAEDAIRKLFGADATFVRNYVVSDKTVHTTTYTMMLVDESVEYGED